MPSSCSLCGWLLLGVEETGGGRKNDGSVLMMKYQVGKVVAEVELDVGLFCVDQ